jgi:2-iminobutanoate/2-iminopropanoate deaminase
MKEQIFVKGGQSHAQGPDAIKANGFIFLAAIRGVDPAAGRATSEDPAVQARFALENVKTALAAAGATLKDVVRVGIYMKHFEDRQAFNKVYREYFPEDQLPARFAVQVLEVGGNDPSRFTLEVIAAVPSK